VTSRNKKIEAVAPTVSEWTTALQMAMLSSFGTGSGGMTTPEIAEVTGWNDRRVRRGLKELIKRGLVVTGRKQVTMISGVTYPQVCYLFKKESG
jgi:predicted ArsR family transcriptional regulator